MPDGRAERKSNMRKNYCDELSNNEKRRYVSKAYDSLTERMRKLVLETARERQCSRAEAELFLRYCDREYEKLYNTGLALSSFLIYGQDSVAVRDVLKEAA